MSRKPRIILIHARDTERESGWRRCALHAGFELGVVLEREDLSLSAGTSNEIAAIDSCDAVVYIGRPGPLMRCACQQGKPILWASKYAPEDHMIQAMGLGAQVILDLTHLNPDMQQTIQTFHLQRIRDLIETRQELAARRTQALLRAVPVANGCGRVECACGWKSSVVCDGDNDEAAHWKQAVKHLQSVTFADQHPVRLVG